MCIHVVCQITIIATCSPTADYPYRVILTIVAEY